MSNGIVSSRWVSHCAVLIAAAWDGEPCHHVVRYYLWLIHGR